MMYYKFHFILHESNNCSLLVLSHSVKISLRILREWMKQSTYLKLNAFLLALYLSTMNLMSYGSLTCRKTLPSSFIGERFCIHCEFLLLLFMIKLKGCLSKRETCEQSDECHQYIPSGPIKYNQIKNFKVKMLFGG